MKSLLAIIFALSTLFQSGNEKLVPDIETVFKDGQIIAKAVARNKTDEKISGNYIFTLKKTGNSTSTSKQSGDFVLNKNEKMLLSRSSINLGQQDTLSCHLIINAGNREFAVNKTFTAEDLRQ